MFIQEVYFALYPLPRFISVRGNIFVSQERPYQDIQYIIYDIQQSKAITQKYTQYNISTCKFSDVLLCCMHRTHFILHVFHLMNRIQYKQSRRIHSSQRFSPQTWHWLTQVWLKMKWNMKHEIMKQPCICLSFDETQGLRLVCFEELVWCTNSKS